jgi:hypothetical protein
LEEIDELFEKRLSTQQFPKFTTTILDKALRDIEGRNPERDEKNPSQVDEKPGTVMVG